MKKLILILVIVFPILANGQDYRVVDWKTDVLNVQTVGIDTFKFDAEPKDYNDAGAITREIGNYFIDFVARCFKIIGSDANTITVVDLEHINSAPQSNQIGRVYQSVVDADSLFQSIGGVDISVLDQMSIYRDVARNNEIICRILKELAAKDTTGIYHANRQLLDDITPEDTTRWATGGLVTETDPTVSALVKSIDATDTTYWGRAETDPTVSAWAKAATKPTYTKSEVGLGNVDNTSDANKPISTATQTALNNLVPYTGAISDLDMGANSINTDTVKLDGVPLLLNTFKQENLGGAGNIFYSTGASSQPASGTVTDVVGDNYIKNQNASAQNANIWISGEISTGYSGYGIYNYGYSSGLWWNTLGLRREGIYFDHIADKITFRSKGHDLASFSFGEFSAIRYVSTTPTGTAPLVVASTTKVDNLNVEMLDGKHASDFELANVNIQNHIENDEDSVVGNEIQDLSRAGNTLSLSGDVTTVDLSDLVNPDLTSYRQKTDHDSLSALDEKSYNSLTDKPTSLPASDVYPWAKAATKPTYTYSEVGAQPAGSYLTSEVDGSTTNEIQALYLGGKIGTVQPIILSDGGQVNVDLADNDNSTTNEIQDLTLNGNILSLSGDGTPVDLSDLAAPDLSGYATTTQLANQLSQTITNGVTTKSPSEDAVFDALAGKATISGTDNYIMKKTGDNTLGNSLIYESEGKIGVATTTPRTMFDVPGSAIIGNTEILTGGGVIINNGGTGNRYAFIDFKGDDVYKSPLRIIRYNTGENTSSAIIHRGKGDFFIYAQDAGRVILRTKNTNALIIDTLQNSGFGTTPSARIHSQSTGTQLRLGYDATNYTDLSTNSAGTFNISPSSGFTIFSGGISASAFSDFTGQVEMTGDDVNFGASTVLRKNGYDIFTAPITMGACGSAGQVLSSTGPNSAPTWTTPATGSGSGITSIGMQVPTGLTVSPSALTSNGTFTIGLQSGYSIPTTANQTNWSTAYTNRITSAVGTTPLALSISNNTLSGYLSWTLTNINNATPSVGYLYYNGSSYSYQAATTTYTLPTASSSTLGGVQIDNADGGLYMSGGWLLQKDNVLTARTPILTDPIAFYDASATAQGKTTFAEIRTIMNGVQSLTSASSITMNFATAPKASLSLATNSTITITNVPDGGEGSIEVTSSGAYTLALAGSTGYTTKQKMGTVAAIASSAHTTVFYWRSGTVLYYGFLLNN